LLGDPSNTSIPIRLQRAAINVTGLPGTYVVTSVQATTAYPSVFDTLELGQHGSLLHARKLSYAGDECAFVTLGEYTRVDGYVTLRHFLQNGNCSLANIDSLQIRPVGLVRRLIFILPSDPTLRDTVEEVYTRRP
jgi:hypothetical protein